MRRAKTSKSRKESNERRVTIEIISSTKEKRTPGFPIINFRNDDPKPQRTP